MSETRFATAANTGPRHETLGEFVFEQVRRRIVEGELAAGVKIDQQALADEFGTSRMPVREALRRLDADGFVTLIPRRGAVVTHLDETEIEQIYEMRAVLEGLAARLALPDVTNRMVAEMEHVLQVMPQVHDVHEWVALNSAFHEKLIEACNRRLLLEEIRRRRRQCEPLIRLYIGFLHRDETAQRQHEAILDACRRQAGEELEALLREHLVQTGRGIAEGIRARKARREGMSGRQGPPEVAASGGRAARPVSEFRADTPPVERQG